LAAINATIPKGDRSLKKQGRAEALPYRSDRGDITYIEGVGGCRVARTDKKTRVNPSFAATNQMAEPQGILEERWITLDGSRMRFLFAGSGPALILLHGLLGYSFSWRHAIPALAQMASVYAVDMLGAGFSDHPTDLDWRLRASAGRLLRFLDAVGVDSCDLLGSSYGGATGMMAAAQAPERIRSLILVSPVNPWSQHGKLLSIFLSSRMIAPLFLRLTPQFRIIFDFYLRRMFGDTRRMRPGTEEGYAEPLRLPGSFEYGLGILRSWNEDLQELEAALPKIRQIPTLLMWGSLDTAVDPASAARLKECFTECRTVLMEGVGHIPYEEVPEQFNSTVAEFLRVQN
jgi:pimeloyl-ACP methyl ester carboxylesterase